MATPTSYELTYDDPCDVESGCGEGPCLGKIKFMPRPHNFCEDVVIQKNLTVAGVTTTTDCIVTSPKITVGGQTFVPTVIQTMSGPHLVLAVY
jgi:hypothetical protein